MSEKRTRKANSQALPGSLDASGSPLAGSAILVVLSTECLRVGGLMFIRKYSAAPYFLGIPPSALLAYPLLPVREGQTPAVRNGTQQWKGQ
jgi:hypothetical protein